MKAFNLSAELYRVARSTASRIAHCAFFKSQEQPQQWLSSCDQWPVFRGISCGVVSGNTLKHCLHVLLGLGVESITGTRNIVSIFRKLFKAVWLMSRVMPRCFLYVNTYCCLQCRLLGNPYGIWVCGGRLNGITGAQGNVTRGIV